MDEDLIAIVALVGVIHIESPDLQRSNFLETVLFGLGIFEDLKNRSFPDIQTVVREIVGIAGIRSRLNGDCGDRQDDRGEKLLHRSTP